MNTEFRHMSHVSHISTPAPPARRLRRLRCSLPAWRSPPAARARRRRAPELVRPVKVVKVEESAPTSRIVLSGSVKARTEAGLGFRVPGKIVERLVDVGDHVEPGEVLARLDTTDLDLALRNAEAAVGSAIVAARCRREGARPLQDAARQGLHRPIGARSAAARIRSGERRASIRPSRRAIRRATRRPIPSSRPMPPGS